MKRLLLRKNKGTYRTELTLPSHIDFASNDYLGLAKSKKLQQQVIQKWQEDKNSPLLGSTGSPLLTGHSLLKKSVEEKIATFHGFESALIFGCGFMANVALLATLPESQDVVFFDQEIHASMRTGINLSCSKAFAFRHNDPDHLRRRLLQHPSSANRYIAIESLYSTDGSLAPLQTIKEIAEEFSARLIVDEAHATALFGKEGRGFADDSGITRFLFAQVVPFGKGIGTYGAAILGSQRLREFLVNFATPYIYSTAPPPVLLHTISESYSLFPKMEEERKKLFGLVDIFKQHFRTASTTPIQPLTLSSANEAKSVAQKLQEKGFDVRALVSPTVPRGKECLRITLHSHNTKEQIAALQKSLEP